MDYILSTFSGKPVVFLHLNGDWIVFPCAGIIIKDGPELAVSPLCPFGTCTPHEIFNIIGDQHSLRVPKQNGVSAFVRHQVEISGPPETLAILQQQLQLA